MPYNNPGTYKTDKFIADLGKFRGIFYHFIRNIVYSRSAGRDRTAGVYKFGKMGRYDLPVGKFYGGHLANIVAVFCA